MNIVGAVKCAKSLNEGSVIVTVFCDSGQRHITRFWNETFINTRGLSWPEKMDCESLIESLHS